LKELAHDRYAAALVMMVAARGLLPQMRETADLIHDECSTSISCAPGISTFSRTLSEEHFTGAKRDN
jgi:hypothetical protein